MVIIKNQDEYKEIDRICCFPEKTGTDSITFKDNGSSLNNYRIYGNTQKLKEENVILGVGDKETNEYGNSRYKIPINVSGKNLLNRPGGSINLICETSKTEFVYTSNTMEDREYIFSAVIDIDTTSNRGFGIALVYKNNKDDVQTLENANLFITDDGFLSCNIPVIANYKIHKLYFYINENQEADTMLNLINCQVELGSVPTTYEPYYEPITTNIYLDLPLYNVNGVSDYIDYQKQKVIRKCGVKIFDGTEWVEVTGSNSAVINRTSYQAYHHLSYLKNIGSKDIEDTINSHFLSQKVGGGSEIRLNMWNGHGYLMYPSNTIFIGYTSSTTERTNRWKEYLEELYMAGNPVTVIYQLITPMEESITLPKISTLRGENNISVATTVQPTNVYIQQGERELKEIRDKDGRILFQKLE